MNVIGAPAQIVKFAKRIKQPAEQIAGDVLAALGLDELPIAWKIILRGCAKDVQDHFAAKYPGKTLESHSYTSREDATCYISVADVTLQVVAHELTHMALNKYFTTDKMPTKLHELIAQAVEEKVCKKYSRWF